MPFLRAGSRLCRGCSAPEFWLGSETLTSGAGRTGGAGKASGTEADTRRTLGPQEGADIAIGHVGMRSTAAQLAWAAAPPLRAGTSRLIRARGRSPARRSRRPATRPYRALQAG